MRLISAGSLVRAQSGPAFALSAAQSEGCHAGVKRRRALRSKTTAWQASAMENFFYVYVLVSEADATQHYTGITRDLPSRLKEHNQGTCIYTARCRPWRIETAIAFRSKAKARAFENI